jgi:phosphoribosylformylglycinamidine (FGAM) synthase PurS component
VRYWALVNLLNEAVSDPDGKAIRRLLVNERDLIKRLNWGKKLEIYLAQLKKMRKN